MLRHILTLLTLPLLIAVPTVAYSQFSDDRATTQSAAVEVRSESKVVHVPLNDGGVDSGLLFQAVANELHWVSGSIAGFTRVFGKDTQSGTRLEPRVVEELVQQFPSVFSYQTTRAGEAIALRVDTATLAEQLSNKKSALRSWLAGVQQISLSELTKVPETWQGVPAVPRRIVVVMAGIHGMVESAEAVAIRLHADVNLPMCVFKYPNDAAMSESSQRLVVELEQLHREYPRSQITLVAHSFGGLIARYAFELSDAENTARRSSVVARCGVDQLIQVCPPNHGSALSDYAPLLEGVEQFSRLTTRGVSDEQRLLLRMITDGFNEAAADLDPNSPDLAKLNQQPRNPDIRYTVLAGNDGPLRSGVSSLLSLAWEGLSGATEGPGEVKRRVADVLNCAELQQGMGDGVVALDSARLAGVDDFEVLEIHHLTWSQLDKPAGAKMIRAIGQRLGISL